LARDEDLLAKSQLDNNAAYELPQIGQDTMNAILGAATAIIDIVAPPIARGFAPTAFPQHLASEQLQSTDKTGSQDSIMTQEIVYASFKIVASLLRYLQMPAQDYHQEPIYAYTGSAAQSPGGGFDSPNLSFKGHSLCEVIQATFPRFSERLGLELKDAEMENNP
jgi:hypothetical protein